MKNRMDTNFAICKEKNKKILILYFPVGDTIFENKDVEWAKNYFDNGCDVLEIGLPNDNPILDGKTVRESMARALNNTNLEGCFEKIKEIRKACPNNILQIMCYYRIIEEMGLEAFAKKCHECDVDAVLAPNIPSDKLLEIDEALGKYNIYNLRFVPYYLNDAVVEDLVKHSKGYIFQQAVDGATGAQPTVSKQIGVDVEIIKKAGVKTPVCAGFGISDAKQLKEALDMNADGAIVGSATISHVIKGDGIEFISSLGKTTYR